MELWGNGREKQADLGQRWPAGGRLLSHRNTAVSRLHLSGRQRACSRRAYGEIGEITVCMASICVQYLSDTLV